MITKNNTFVAPPTDEAKNEVLAISDATTRIKEVITNGILNGLTKDEISNAIRAIVKDALKHCGRLNPNVVLRTLNNMAQRDYYQLTNNMRIINQDAVNKIPGYNLNPTQVSSKMIDNNVFRNKITDSKLANVQIANYRDRIRDELKTLSANPALATYQNEDGEVMHMSARNYAEMTTRYKANLNDLEKYQSDGKDLVWCSSHADASPRCAPYQGKLYSISGKNAGRVIDGEKVYDLNEAMLGPKKDGNGIIDGYNCRHYLIPYVANQPKPQLFTKSQTKEEYAINTRLRRMENNIRQMKSEKLLAQQSGDKERVRQLTKRIKRDTLLYSATAIENDRPAEIWRTRIMRDEDD